MAEPYQTRLPDELASEVDEMTDKYGLTTAEAMRQLVRRGVEDRHQHRDTGVNNPSPQPVGQIIGWALLSISIALFVFGVTTAAGAVAAAAAVVFLWAAARQFRGGDHGD